MKKLTSLLVLSLAVLALSFALPVAAQDDVEFPGPGEGDPVILPNLGNDISTLNPILSSDGSSNAVIARLFPTFIGVDPATNSLQPGAINAIDIEWIVADDGVTYTFVLRDDMFWSDGTPVTANDIAYSFAAIASGETDTPLTYVLDTVASVTAVDDFTLEVVLVSPACSAINDIGAIPVVPSHIYSAVFPTFADMNESDFNLSDPGATSDAWVFGNFRPGEQVTLLADPDFNEIDPPGYVVPAGWIYKNIADQTLIVEQFLAGDITYISSTPSDRKDEIRALAAEGGAQLYETPATTTRFIALNEADPTNPQPGLDDDGNAIDQGVHPILGDIRTRQALMHALDWEGANIAVFNEEGIQLASHWLPTDWYYDEEAVPFYDFDLDTARALLDEVGWVDDDGDEGTADTPTPRVAQGVETVEDGTPLAFELITNAGNTENESLMLLLVDFWAQIGVDLDAVAVDFNILVDELLSQTYDAVMIFWGFGSPAEPFGAISTTFSPSNDVPGGGFNTTSYNNPRVTEILSIANDPNQTEGCNQDIQRELYTEAFRILRDDVAWIWISTSIVTTAAQPWVEGFDPLPGGALWNESAFAIEAESR